MAVASGDGAVYFFQPKFHLHLNPNDSAHYQVCDSICASELDPLTLYFAHRSNLYTYNIFTKEAKLAFQPYYKSRWRGGEIYSVKEKYGFLAACGEGVIYVKRLADNKLLCPLKDNPIQMDEMNNGVDINYHCGELRLFVAHNNGYTSIFSLPSVSLVACLQSPSAVNYISCSPDNQYFITLGDRNFINLLAIDHNKTNLPRPKDAEEETQVVAMKGVDNGEEEEAEEAETTVTVAPNGVAAPQNTVPVTVDQNPMPQQDATSNDNVNDTTRPQILQAQDEADSEGSDELYSSGDDFEDDESDDDYIDDDEDSDYDDAGMGVGGAPGQPAAAVPPVGAPPAAFPGHLANFWNMVTNLGVPANAALLNLFGQLGGNAPPATNPIDTEETRMQQFGIEPYTLADELDIHAPVGSLPAKRRKVSYTSYDDDDEELAGDPQYADWSPDSKMFAVTSETGRVSWWDSETRVKLGELTTKTSPFKIQFAKRNNIFAVAERSVIHIVNPSDPKGQHQVVELKPEEVPSKILGRPATRKKWYITGLCFSEDASKLFVGTKKGILEFSVVGVPSLLELCVAFVQQNTTSNYWSEEDWNRLPPEMMEKIFPPSLSQFTASKMIIVKSSKTDEGEGEDEDLNVNT